MSAEKIMVTHLVTAQTNELVHDVFLRMREAKLRMLPVLDEQKHIVGVISTFSVMEHIVPDYLHSGDLNQISYAPDMGILHRQYEEVATQTVDKVMNSNPLLVQNTESLLSVAAALSSYGRHEYAMVVDKENHLLGVVSAGDILDGLDQCSSGVNNA